MLYKIPVSNGEILDKISILRIKEKNIDCPAKQKNILNELNALIIFFDSIVAKNIKINTLYNQLSIVNNKLWNTEDMIRDKERKKTFDREFIDLARSIYRLNDERSIIKKEINLLSESDLIEEKSYEQY